VGQVGNLRPIVNRPVESSAFPHCDSIAKTMTSGLFWIPGPWRGRLAVVTRPRGGDWLEDEMAEWRRAGIDTVVSLLEEPEAGELYLTREAAAAEANGIRFIAFSIPDRGVRPPGRPRLR
jgi:hypothetical protein